MLLCQNRLGKFKGLSFARAFSLLSLPLCLGACGAVDPSAAASLEDDQAATATESAALTADDGYVQSITLRMVGGDPVQTAYTHNGSRVQLDTTPSAGKATLDAPPAPGAQHRGKATLRVTCVNPNGVAIVKTQGGLYNLVGVGKATFTAPCDPNYRAAKSELILNPSDGIGDTVNYLQLAPSPSADRDFSIQIKVPGVAAATSSRNFVKYGYLTLNTAQGSAWFRYFNASNDARNVLMSYRIQCSGTWTDTVTRDAVVGPQLPTNFVLSCPAGTVLERVDTRLQNIR
ncbi:MAG TPA: hypothetical protein VFQ61_09940 [Polyangiaceae bacterium]|nr:hypothetical protein [Polyangiaceae bacterium]